MWLGICIFVLFSLSLNWFMRDPRGRQITLPKDLGEWVRCEAHASEPGGVFWERRTLLVQGSLLRRPYLVEQRRLRREHDGEILEVSPERRLPA